MVAHVHSCILVKIVVSVALIKPRYQRRPRGGLPEGGTAKDLLGGGDFGEQGRGEQRNGCCERLRVAFPLFPDLVSAVESRD